MEFFTLLILFLSLVPLSLAEDDDENTYFSDVKDYIEEDLVLMWNTSPNQWSEEYWELLAGVVATVFGLLLFIFIVCCAPICFFSERDTIDAKETPLVDGTGAAAEGQITEPSVTVTGGNADKDIEKGAAGVTSDGNNDLAVAANAGVPATGAAVSSPASPNQKKGFFGQVVTSKSMTDDDTDNGRPRSPGSNIRGKRKRRSLWSEVVLVWTEFLEDTFGTQSTPERYETPFHTLSSDGSEPGRKKTHAVPYKAPSFRRKSKSPRKRSVRDSKSVHSRKSKSPRKSRKINRSPENKVEKYDGTIV